MDKDSMLRNMVQSEKDKCIPNQKCHVFKQNTYPILCILSYVREVFYFILSLSLFMAAHLPQDTHESKWKEDEQTAHTITS